MKKKLPFLIPILITIFVFLLPVQNPGLKLRFYFYNTEGDSYRLYYSTNYSSQMDEDKVLLADYNPELKMATFSLSPELVRDVSCLRLDFPPISQLVEIRDVSVSSAGMVTHRFNPSRFFAEENLTATNCISDMNVSPAKARAYFQVDGNNPYIVFSNPLLNKILFFRSRYIIPRLLFCLFVWIGFLLTRKNLFSFQKGQEV